MKTNKSITTVLLPLLWAVLLCFYVSFIPVLLQENSFAHDAATAALKQEDHGRLVAWIQPSTSVAAIASTDHTPVQQLLFYGLLFAFVLSLPLKPRKSIPGFSTLSAQFRILPNGP